MGFDFSRLSGVDSSSGSKSSSSSSSPCSSWSLASAGRARLGLWLGVPRMLGCLALLLNIPVLSADPGFTGVPISPSTPTLLDLTFPNMLGCRCLGLKPLDMTLPIGLSTLVISWLCAISLSTLSLLPISISCPRPRMLGWRTLLLNVPGMVAELSTLAATLPRLPISTSGLLDSISLGACATASLSPPLPDADSFSASRRDIAESRRFFGSSNTLVFDALGLAARVEGPETIALPLVALVIVAWVSCSIFCSWEDSIASEASLGLRDGPGGLPRRGWAAGAEGITLARFGRGIFVIFKLSNQ